MEKQIKLTTSELVKWLTFLAIIVSAFVVNQVDISYLKEQNRQAKEERDIMKERAQEQERIVAEINSKLNTIYDDVRDIKGFLLDNHNRSRQ